MSAAAGNAAGGAGAGNAPEWGGENAAGETPEAIWRYIYNASLDAAIRVMRDNGYRGLTGEQYNIEFVKIAKGFAKMDLELQRLGIKYTELIESAPNNERGIVISARKEEAIPLRRRRLVFNGKSFEKLSFDRVEDLMSDIAWKASWHATSGAAQKLIGKMNRDALEEIHKTVYSIWKSHSTDLNDMVTAFCIAALTILNSLVEEDSEEEDMIEVVLDYAAQQVYRSSLAQEVAAEGDSAYNDIYTGDIVDITKVIDIARTSGTMTHISNDTLEIIHCHKILLILDKENRTVYILPTFNQADEVKEAMIETEDSIVVSFSTLFFKLVIDIPADAEANCQMTFLFQPRGMDTPALQLYTYDIPRELGEALRSIASGEAIAAGAHGGRRRRPTRRHKHKRKTHRRRTNRRAGRKTTHRRKH